MISRRTIHQLITSITLLIMYGLLLTYPTYAATRKLSIPNPNGNTIQTIAISPDGQYAVYIANHESEFTFELYSVSLAGGAPTKLNPDFDSGQNVFAFSISPDSASVVYRARQGIATQLYAVSITGGPATKLSTALFAAGGVSSRFAISPDSASVVYYADINVDDKIELYTVPLTGGTPTKLNVDFAKNDDIFQLAISPDSASVVYLVKQDTDNLVELYTIPITNGNPIKLNANLVDDGDVYSFTISSDSTSVVYRADQDIDEVFELYAVPLTGGSPTKLNPPFTINDNNDVFDGFTISPDSTTVVYLADQDIENKRELYRVPLEGGSPIKLNPPFTINDKKQVSSNFEISSDNTTVVYRATQDTDLVSELYAVPLTGGNPTKLNPHLDGERDVLDFAISPDSASVVYRADQDIDEVAELYTVPLTGGNATKLHPDLDGERDIQDFTISPNSTWVVYSANQDTESIEELYIADNRRVTIGFATDTATVAEEAQSIEVAVVLDESSVGSVTVDYAVTGGTATNGTDFTLPDGQLVIPFGQPGGTITVPILEDDQVEGNETVEITLSNPTNTTLGNTTFTLIIEDTTIDSPDAAIYLPLLVR